MLLNLKSSGEERRRLLKSVGSMLTVQAGSVALALPASILAARMLGPEQFGLLLLAQRVTGASLLVAHASAAHGFAYRAAAAKERRELTSLVVAAYYLAVAITPFGAGIALIISLCQDLPGLLPLTLLLVVFMPALLLSQFLAAVLRGQLRTTAYNVVRISQPLLYFLAVVVLTIGGAERPVEYAAAFVIAQWGAAAVAGFLARDHWVWDRPSWDACRNVLSYGLRAHFGQAGRELNIYLDQIILATMVPLRELGVYSVAASSAGAASGLNGALVPLIQPIVQRADGPGSRKRRSWGLIVAVTVGMGAILFVAACLMPLLLRIAYGVEYEDAAAVVRILLFAVFLDSVSAAAAAVLFGLNRPGVTGLATAVCLAVGVLSLVAFVPTYGIEGAAWASVASYGGGLLINLEMVRRSVARQPSVQ